MTTRALAVDFHVHTPLSRCHELEAWTAEDFLTSARAAGLDGVVVTDHHTAENAWKLRGQAAEFEVTVHPGMELTTRDGHLLVLFDPLAGEAASEALLSCLAVPDVQRGNGSYILGASMLEAVAAARGVGATCIPAHIDRWPNGFLERQISFRTREAIVCSPQLNAVEITLAHTQALWEAGAMPPYSRPMTCVRGSDAHGLKEIGRRPTWVFADGHSFAELVSALSVPGSTRLQNPCTGGEQ